MSLRSSWTGLFEMFPSEAYEYEEEWCNEPVRDIVLRPQVGASQHPEET